MIEHSKLIELLHYNLETGLFHWAKSRPKVKEGNPAGCLDHNGYIRIEVGGKTYAAHRLAWFYINKEWPSNEIDHINRNKSDNRIENLRQAQHGQNRANSKTTNKHGLKGVSFKKWIKFNCWEAKVKHNKKDIYLGCYPTKELAHEAYCRAAKKLHGEFFNVNHDEAQEGFAKL